MKFTKLTNQYLNESKNLKYHERLEIFAALKKTKSTALIIGKSAHEILYVMINFADFPDFEELQMINIKVKKHKIDSDNPILKKYPHSCMITIDDSGHVS